MSINFFHFLLSLSGSICCSPFITSVGATSQPCYVSIVPGPQTEIKSAFPPQLFRAHLHLPFCLRNKVSHMPRRFVLSFEIIGITSFGPSLYSGVVGAELTNTNVSIFITADAGNTWREVRPPLHLALAFWLRLVVPSDRDAVFCSNKCFLSSELHPPSETKGGIKRLLCWGKEI